MGSHAVRLRASLAITLVALVVAAGTAGASASEPSSSTSLTPRQFANMMLGRRSAQWMSGAARTLLLAMAGKTTTSASTLSPESPTRKVASVVPLAPTPANTRVNDPSGDGLGDPNMTTQSEATVAANGSDVVVGYNDDGTSSPYLTPAFDMTGYSCSNDGGLTFHDAQLPNPTRGVNAGDPVVATDSSGDFYFASLAENLSTCCLDVVVGKSTDGGQTFSTPTYLASLWATRLHVPTFVSADKPWIATGPNPSNPGTDIVYVSWTDFSQWGTTSIDMTFSTDGGQTWETPFPIAQVQTFFGRDRRNLHIQYIQGSSLAVDPSTGSVYVGWERFVEMNPRRSDAFVTRQERIMSAGPDLSTQSSPVRVAITRPVGRMRAPCGNVLVFGPESWMRTNEFPSLGVGPGGSVFMAFNGTDRSGNSRVGVATSSDGGGTWTRRWISPTGTDSFMPSLAAGASGIQVTYYERTSPTDMKEVSASSPDGVTYATSDLSSVSFPGAITVPGSDPLLAFCYMGDYNQVALSGGTAYAAWGDNRDTVTNGFYPSGRPDPNVYFAKP